MPALPLQLFQLLLHQVLESQGVGLIDVAGMDDTAMKRAGLVTPRSRKLIVDELVRVGLRK